VSLSYRLAPLAIDDIEAIADYLRDRNPAAALELVTGFMRRFEMLVRHPYSGVSRDDILPDIRHLVLGSYLALYRIENGDPVILRVLHGRQDIEHEDIG
jgi:toxin ParE1/3/4